MNNHDLFDKYINGTLSPEEEAELEEILKDNETADHFAEYIIETNMMVNAAQNIEAADSQNKKSVFPARLYALASAAVLIVGLMIFSTKQPAAFEIVATESNLFQTGSFLKSGSYHLSSGILTLKSPAGDILKYKGPADFSLQSATKTSLEQGTMLVKLDPETSDFTVTTPFGSVKDLGTSFGLISDTASTEVHVYEGKVLVNSGNSSRELTRGDSCSLSSTGEIIEINFAEDVLSDKSARIMLMGDRQLKPGETMELILDRNGRNLTGEISLSYESETNFKYKLIGYSKGKKIFESKTHDASDKFKTDIPAQGVKDLTLELKVVKGHAINGVLNIKNLTLSSEGYRPYEGETLISSGAEWYYMFKTPPPANWQEADFSASDWSRGPASIGYGDKDLKTKIGDDSLKKTVSRIYFRHDFEMTDPELNSLKKINVNLLADDGALVFLNGYEVIRYNLPEGPVDSSTRALKVAVLNTGETIYNNFSLPPKHLKMGKNNVTVILIQRKGISSDMRFDLQMNVF